MDIDLTLVGGLLLFALVFYYFYKNQNSKHPEDQALRQKYKFEIHNRDERPIKVEKLYIYPMRGIIGIEVPAIKVTKTGVKYDREWALYDKDTLSVRHQAAEVKLTLLRQEIVKDPATKQKYLVISIIDSHKHERDNLPCKELRILIKKTAEGEIVDTKKVKGVSEGKLADEWFSKFLGKDVIFLRSAPGFKKEVPKTEQLKWSLQEDCTQGFISKAVIHIINEASVRDLRERVLVQYPDEKERSLIKVETIPFRPNIVIDTGVPYDEDTFSQARIGNTLLRLVGYCTRCKAVANNYETNDRNPELEPNPTLAKYRMHKEIGGTLFGTYHQVDIVKSQDQFRRLFWNYPLLKNRKYDENQSIICVGDELRVRVTEKKIEFPSSN